MKKHAQTLREIVSHNIRTARIEAGLTQQALADKAGFKVSYVARLETDPQNISLEVLEKIARSLEKPAYELLLIGNQRELKNKDHQLFQKGMQFLKAYDSTITGD